MSTPALHLQTLFQLDGNGRISGTREPEPSPVPLFSLIRDNAGCASAVRSDVPWHIAEELDGLAREESLISDLREAPVHAERYMSLVQGSIDAGPAFTFPDEIAQSCGTVFVDDIQSFDRHFSGWKASEMPERTPIVALVEEGCAVSICFSARRSNVAAEAGVETAVAFRGRGLGPRVAAAWAIAIRASGRMPLYSTSWSNPGSSAVARKLGLIAYASAWNIF